MTAIASAHATEDQDPARQYLRSLERLLDYYRRRGLDDTDLTDAELQFAVALARYRLSSPGGKMIDERLHVMAFGGAGCGKSTTVNVLLGADVAEVNAQAGYTRHPIAFFRSEETRPHVLWPESLGPLKRTDAQAPANTDEDRYSWKQLDGPTGDPGFLRRYVVWDGPDLTAKDSTYYQSRVIEIAALSELTVYVASDERYNDELPTNFLQAMLSAGKHVVVALTKVSAADSDQFVTLFKEQVLSKLQHAERVAAIVPIPMPPPGRIKELWTDSFPYGDQLREALENGSGDFQTAKRQSKQAAAAYLHHQQSRLLEPLRVDLGEWKGWTELVRLAANEAVKRYDREYLVQVRYGAFSKALEQIVTLLRPAGALQPLAQGLELLCVPYRLLKSGWQRLFPASQAGAKDEDRCLDLVRQGMIDSLQIACSQRKRRHRLWRDLHAALDHGGSAVIEQVYQQARGRQRIDLQQRVQRTVRSAMDAVELNPISLNALRTARFGLDLVAVGIACLIAYRTTWAMAILTIPLALGLAEDIVRFAVGKYVGRQKAGLVSQQKENIRELIQVAYIDSLLQMPSSMGRQLYELATLEERLLRELAAAMGEGDSAA